MELLLSQGTYFLWLVVWESIDTPLAKTIISMCTIVHGEGKTRGRLLECVLKKGEGCLSTYGKKLMVTIGHNMQCTPKLCTSFCMFFADGFGHAMS